MDYYYFIDVLEFGLGFIIEYDNVNSTKQFKITFDYLRGYMQGSKTSISWNAYGLATW